MSDNKSNTITHLRRQRLVWHADKSLKGLITVSFQYEPTVFNLHMLHIEVDKGLPFSVFDTLYSVDTAGKLVRGLAV